MESHDLSEGGKPRTAAARDRSKVLKDGAFLAVVGALILAGVGYWLFFEQTARFVAPVACRGEYSAGYEVTNR